MDVEVFDAAVDAAALLKTVRVADFHQSPKRLAWLRQHGYEGRLVVVGQGGKPSTIALLERTGSRWHLWKGPAGDAPSAEALGAILDACSGLSPATLVLDPQWVYESVLRRAGFHPSLPFATLLVPTAGDDAQILARMKPGARSRVRHAARAALEFAEEPRRLEEYHAVYAQAMHATRSPDFATLDELRSLSAMAEVHVFVAVSGGELAAGSICFEHEDAVEARYVATNPAQREVGPMNFLHFETIRWAAARGKGWFDLSGWAAGAVDAKEARINRFKEGFGGIRREYPVFERD